MNTSGGSFAPIKRTVEHVSPTTAEEAYRRGTTEPSWSGIVPTKKAPNGVGGNAASARSAESALEFLEGGEEMGELFRQKDWAQTPLGPAGNWPQSLRSAVSICLGSAFPTAIYWGPQLVLLYNDAWRPISGAEHPDALGQPASAVWPEIWDTLGPLFEQVTLTGKATRSNDQLLAMRRHEYTEECYFDYTFSPIRGESGRVEGIFNAVLETTERVISERRLGLVRELSACLAQERTYDAATALAGQTLGKDSADVPFALLYLLSAEEMEARLAATVNLDAGTLASPARISLVEQSTAFPTWPLAEALRTREPVLAQNTQARFGLLPGGPWPESSSTALVLPIARAGRELPYGWLVAGISPRRALDADYRGFFDLATSHIAQAFANVEVYEQERKRAEAFAEIDRAKTAFLSNVSHEFRTPLTLMLGPIEALLAKSSSFSIEDRTQLLTAHRNSLRLLKLVNSLLDFSRIEAGRVQATFAPLNLTALTEDLASIFRSAMESVGLQLIFKSDPLPQNVYVDCEMWEKIVLNLLSNAFKFTFAGSVSVTLRDCGSRVELTVADTGTGIPEEELPHLFERFHRVEGAKGRTYEGAGIGLALVQELVKLHGGTISVTSIQESGSAFTVSLPFGSAHLPTDQVRTSLESSTSASRLRLEAFTGEALTWLSGSNAGFATNRKVVAEESPKASSSGRARILLADDNADMRDHIERILGQNYDVLSVRDGAEALKVIRQHPPDLLLTDVMMPSLDGIGLLNAVRGDLATHTLPVIFLSARAGEEAHLEGLQAGANDYLVKPFTAKELQARVNTHVEMARARNDSAAREAALRAEAEAARDEAVSMLESITDGFVALDKDWRVTYVNAEAERLNGMSRRDVLGRNHWEVFPEAIGTVIHREFHRAALERIAVEFDNYYAPWQRWFHLKAYPAPEGGLSVFYQDVTKNYLAAAERDRANRLLTTILHSTPDFIAAKDLEGRYLAVNEATARIIGRPVSEIVGRTDLDVASRETAEPIMAGDREVMRTGTVLSVEAQYPDQTGTVRCFQSIKAPLREADGAVAGVVVVARDVTAQRAAEKALKESEAHQAFLLHLTDALRDPPDPREVVATATALLGEHLAAGCIGFAEADPAGDQLTVVRDWTTTAFSSVVGTHPLGDFGPPVIAELRAGRTVKVTDIMTDPLSAGQVQQETYTAMGARSFVDVPLIRNGRLAAIFFVLSKAPRVWTDTEVSLIEEVAERVRSKVAKARGETALRASEARFRAAVQANSSVMWTNNASGEMEGEQPAWGAFTGQRRDDYQGYGWSKAVHPDDAQPTIDAWSEAVTSRRMFAFEHRVRRYDGTWRLCSIRAVPVFDPDGNIVEWVGVHNDITEERILLTALQRSEARFRQLADAMPQMVWTAQPDGCFEYYNERWYEFTGFDRGSFGDMSSWESIVHPADIARLRDKWTAALSTGDSYSVESRFFDRKTNSYRWFLCQALAARDGQADILKWFGTCTDIDQQKETEKELRRANLDLEQFAYSASHDLQEPLRSVSIYSELLDKRYRGMLDGQAIEFLTYLKSGASRMEMLVRDLLAYTQVTKLDAPPEEADADVVLQTVLSNLAESIGQRHAQISFRPLPVLKIHRIHLQQLFQNLIGNALKYCTEERPVVRLEAERQNGHWLVSVCDNGIGIDPEYKERIFGLFKRLHTADEYSGTGLGLAICQRIVERYHGRIWVESQLGKGSTFYFTLPA